VDEMRIDMTRTWVVGEKINFFTFSKLRKSVSGVKYNNSKPAIQVDHSICWKFKISAIRNCHLNPGILIGDHITEPMSTELNPDSL